MFLSFFFIATEKIPVMRGQWFIDGTWQPLEEEESNLIEQEHLSCFKGQQMQENFDMEISKPVDGKEGKRTLTNTSGISFYNLLCANMEYQV